MNLVRRVAFCALVFLPACGGCSSCIEDDASPTVSSEPTDADPAKFLRKPFTHHRWRFDGGARQPNPVAVAPDASIE